MELEGKILNFLGDSITEGVGASSEGNCYVNILARNSGAVCRNYGIAGTRIARQSRPSEDPRFDLDFCSRAPQMEPGADVVIVFGGTNDFGHGDAPLGTMSDRTPDSFYGALHTLYTSLLVRFSGAEIIILTPLHRAIENRAGSPCLEAYVCAIREVARYYSLPVLDLYESADFSRYTPDGLHPDDTGHKLLAERIQNFLEALETKNASSLLS